MVRVGPSVQLPSVRYSVCSVWRWRLGARALATLGLLGFCVVLTLAPLSARLRHASSSELASLAQVRTQTTATLVVTSDPRLLTAKGSAGSPRVAVDAKITGVVLNGRAVRLSGPVLILAGAGEFRNVLPGQRIRLDVTLQPPLGDGLLEAVAVAREDPELLGQPPWWQRAAGTVRDRLRLASSSLPAEPAGLLPGLVDGDTRDLDPVLAERFRIAGLTHLVAVSGTNCSIVVGSVLLMLRRFRVGPRTSAVVAVLVLIAFVVVARPSPSVLRAAAMAAVDARRAGRWT